MAVEPELVGKRASKFDDLAFKCSECGVAFSNAADPNSRRVVYREPQMNVPIEVRSGLDEALAGAVNARNRPSKRFKFGSETSEDAVTWTVFRGLESLGRLNALADACWEPHQGPVSLVLWGHPIGGPSAQSISRELGRACSELGERDASRSEPDVIVAWPQLLVFAEAKLTGVNPREPGAPGFGLYLTRPELFSLPFDSVRDAGFYELVRNWVIGANLADRLGLGRFVLANLGPQELESDHAKVGLQLATSPNRQFVHVTWSELLGEIELPGWFENYVTAKSLGAR